MTENQQLIMKPKDKCRDCSGRGILIIRHPEVTTMRRVAVCPCVKAVVGTQVDEKCMFAITNPIGVSWKEKPKVAPRVIEAEVKEEIKEEEVA